MSSTSFGRAQPLPTRPDSNEQNPHSLPPINPPPARKLAEIADADTNSRSFLPQPSSLLGLKHRISSNEGTEPPPAKRAASVMTAMPLRPRSTLSANITAGPPRPKPVSGRIKAAAAPPMSHKGPPLSSGHARVGSAYTAGTIGRAGSRSSMARPASAAGFHSGFQPGVTKQQANPSADVDRTVEQMNKMHEEWDLMRTKVMEMSDNTKNQHLQVIEIQKEQISELNRQLASLSGQNSSLQGRHYALEEDLRQVRANNTALTIEVDAVGRRGQMKIEEIDHQYRRQITDLHEHHRHELAELKLSHEAELEAVNKAHLDALNKIKADAEKDQQNIYSQIDELKQTHKDNLDTLKNDLHAQFEVERDELTLKIDELVTYGQDRNHALSEQVKLLQAEKAAADTALAQAKSHLLLECQTIDLLRSRLAEEQAQNADLVGASQALQSKIDFLQSDSQAQGAAFAEMRDSMNEAVLKAQEAEERLRHEERLRRKLHNRIQEMKGNIRVFCRVRPVLPKEVQQPAAGPGSSVAEISYPDQDDEGKEMVVAGPARGTLTGLAAPTMNSFSFDRVLGPGATNADVFDEVSQLVQSALDGYNVCIFCYGQTGSGKTHTMSRPVDGIIPRAVDQIWRETERLRPQGWRFELTGEFVEVYNEQLNDLLGPADEIDRKKLEIRHEPAPAGGVAGRTTVVGATVARLDSPGRLHELLARAAENRSVAATRSNERSSRSHTVFVLRLDGVRRRRREGAVEGGGEGEGDSGGEGELERVRGVLNLVDLAGSERVKASGVEGARMREAQNINRSLSCLGDVIAALGSNPNPSQSNGNGSGSGNGSNGTANGTANGGGAQFVPYRNSKLTYLLQNSLGGAGSKTLMLVMVSPLAEHVPETLTSLKFAAKVHATHVGVARRLPPAAATSGK